MLAVQIVEILWTKATRGAPRADERARLPRAFPLSDAVSEYRVEPHRLSEWGGFAHQPLDVRLADSVPSHEGVLSIRRESGDTCLLGLIGAPGLGKPRRHPRPETLRLQPGETARLVINARHASYAGQHYSETVFNVAYGDRIDSSCFVSRSPDYVFELLADLF